jgi:hypothetical protein
VEAWVGDADSEKAFRMGGGWGCISPKVLLARVRKEGTWGFYNHTLGEMHLWARRGTSRRNLFELIFHEVLHAFVALRGSKAHAAMAPLEAAANLAYKRAELAHRRLRT